MSPKGVEHTWEAGAPIRTDGVHPSMSPKGVEHRETAAAGLTIPPRVHPSMSPKGVEHNIERSRLTGRDSCIHQCRRKALST